MEAQLMNMMQTALGHSEQPYSMCGGIECARNDPHCKNAVLVRRDASMGFREGNIAWISCFQAQILTKNGATKITEAPKYRPNDKCWCGCGKKNKKVFGR